MNTREQIITRIRSQLPFGMDANCDLAEDQVLSELGINSLHLITMLLTLQREFSLEVDDAAWARMPTTIGDLVTLVERGTTLK